jgi:hypothetical protein
LTPDLKSKIENSFDYKKWKICTLPFKKEEKRQELTVKMA